MSLLSSPKSLKWLKGKFRMSRAAASAMKRAAKEKVREVSAASFLVNMRTSQPSPTSRATNRFPRKPVPPVTRNFHVTLILGNCY